MGSTIPIMPEFDWTIRTSSEAGAKILEQAVIENPESLTLLGKVLVSGIATDMQEGILSQTPEVDESPLFQQAREFLANNPHTTASDLSHRYNKPPEQEKLDLAALILLMEKALADGKPTALHGLELLYQNAVITNHLRSDRPMPSIGAFGEHMVSFFKKSCDQLDNVETGRFKGGEDRVFLRATEMRIIIGIRGLAGVKVPHKDLINSEGVSSIQSRLVTAGKYIYSSLKL